MAKKNSKPDEWMPLYVAKYIADTTLFTTEEHGAYLLLLLSAWRNGGVLPDDDRKLALVVKATPSRWRKLRDALASKFEIGDGVWRQKRLSALYEHATKTYASRVENGKRGGRPNRTGGKNETEHVTEKGTERLSKKETERLSKTEPFGGEKEDITTTTTLTTNRKDSAHKSIPYGDLSGSSPDAAPSDPKAQKTRILRAKAVELLAWLNTKTGRNFEPVPANVDPIVARLKEGFAPEIVRQVIAKKCREWGTDEKMADYLRPKTLFNATNFANYAGEIVSVTPETEATP